MIELEMLNVLIGIVLVYFTLSLVVTAVMEQINTWRSLRCRVLNEAIASMFGEEASTSEAPGTNTRAFFEHPRVFSLGRGDAKPSYIPPRMMAEVFIEVGLAPKPGEGAATIGTIPRPTLTDWLSSPLFLRARLQDLAQSSNPSEKSLGEVLGSAHQRAGQEAEKFLQEVEEWTKQVRERATGWLKQRQRLWLVSVSAIAALVCNADSLRMFDLLQRSPELQARYLALADGIVLPECALGSGQPGAENSGAACPTSLKQAAESIAPFTPLLGWQDDPLWDASCFTQVITGLFSKLFGLAITTFALMLGAPFWFDVLQKFMNVRNSLKPKTPEDEAADSTKKASSAKGTPEAVVPAPSALPLASPPKGVLRAFNPAVPVADLNNAYWMARFSDLAYERSEAQLRAALNAWGYTLEHALLTATIVDTQYFIASNEACVIVAFRGSESNVTDWLQTNANFTLKPWLLGPSQVMVHTGFCKALTDQSLADTGENELTSVQARVKAQLEGLLNGGSRHLWITGHSLGGALAVLTAAHLAHHKLPISGVYTFGQPKVGNQEFALEASKLLGRNYVRFVNFSDPVPLVPTIDFEKGQYQHFGALVYFNERGEARADATSSYRAIDAFVSKRMWDSLWDYLTGSIGDHLRYSEVIARALNLEPDQDLAANRS